MSKQLLCELMSDYFDDPVSDTMSRRLNIKKDDIDIPMFDANQTPVNIKRKIDWKRSSNPTSFVKSFKFDTLDSYYLFITQVFEYENKLGHHAKILVDYPDISFMVYTRNINDITELDIKYVREIDKIYHDTQGTRSKD